MDTVIRFVFEKIPGLSLLNGYKRKLGDLLLILTALAVALQQIAPHLSDIILPGSTLEGLIALLAVLTKLVGQAHARAKDAA